MHITPHAEHTKQQTRYHDATLQARRVYDSAGGGQTGNQAVAELCNQRCPFCHTLLVPKCELTTVGTVGELLVKVWPDCQCQGARSSAERQVAEDERRVREARAAAFLGELHAAGLEGDLARMTLENLKPRKDWEGFMAIKKQVAGYIQDIITDKGNAKNWLVLWGNYGTGKSHGAVAIVHEVVKAGGIARTGRTGRPAYFANWLQHCHDVKASWGDKDDTTYTTNELDNRLIRPVLVLDDVDYKRTNPEGWSAEELYRILNYRYVKMYPTIITCRHDPLTQALAPYLTAAGADRVFERAVSIHFDGPSIRTGER